MKLPFLKNRMPRQEVKPLADKMVNASASDHIDHAMATEHFEAHEAKDPKRFRASLEAMVHNMFDWEGEDNASDAG